MPGAFLTAAEKRQIIRDNWDMVSGEIERALEVEKQQPRRKLLQKMLTAAKAWDGEGVITSARKLCRLTKRVPPGTYYQGAKVFKLSGERVYLPKMDTMWSLGLVHPQIYR